MGKIASFKNDGILGAAMIVAGHGGLTAIFHQRLHPMIASLTSMCLFGFQSPRRRQLPLTTKRMRLCTRSNRNKNKSWRGCLVHVRELLYKHKPPKARHTVTNTDYDMSHAECCRNNGGAMGPCSVYYLLYVRVPSEAPFPT